MPPTDDPIQPDKDTLMNGLAELLDRWLEKAYGQRLCFTLFVSEFGEPGRMNYISNGDRSDMISVMKEWLIKHGEEVKLPKH